MSGRHFFQTISGTFTIVFAVVGAGLAPPVFGNQGNSQSAAPSPTTAKQSAPTSAKSQKLSNPLNDYLDEAQRNIDKNDFESAIPPLQKFLIEKPDVAFAHFQLAYVYTALKRFADARAEYEKTIALDPKMSEAQLNLGIMLLDIDPSAAITPLAKAVELLPSQPRPRFLLGAAQERTGNLEAAAKSFDGAAHLDSSDPDALVHLGNIYLKLNRPADAEPKFRAALGIQANSPPALLGLAKSLDAQKKPEAQEAYRNYLATQPNDPGAKRQVIRSLIDEKKYDEALAELDRTETGQPPTLDSLKLRADIVIGQKKWDDAIVVLQKAIALAPQDAQLHGGLGRVYLQKRDFSSAEKELKAALELNRNNLIYWKDLSTTFYLAGNYPATLSTLDIIAKVEPPTAGEWFVRALCLDKLNQPKPAYAAYQKFLELDHDQNPDQVWQAQQRSKILKKMIDQKR